MKHRQRRVSAAEFVQVSELLEQAFPKADAVPDYLSHDCERAEQSLLSTLNKAGDTEDEKLAELLGLSLRRPV